MVSCSDDAHTHFQSYHVRPIAHHRQQCQAYSAWCAPGPTVVSTNASTFSMLQSELPFSPSRLHPLVLVAPATSHAACLMMRSLVRIWWARNRVSFAA